MLKMIDNNHTIKIAFGIANPEQVKVALYRAAQRASKIIGYIPEYKINIAYNCEGNHRSWGYMYTSSPRFFSLLTGESVVVESSDSEWDPPEYKEIDWMYRLGGHPRGFRISDIRPPIARKSIPLLNLTDLYEYTDEQREKVIQRFGVDKLTGYIKFEVAVPRKPAPDQYAHILISYDVPGVNFSYERLEKIFTFYSRSRGYPIISYTKNRLVKVVFDPATTDAQYALLMTGVLYDNEPGKALTFNYLRKRKDDSFRRFNRK